MIVGVVGVTTDGGRECEPKGSSREGEPGVNSSRSSLSRGGGSWLPQVLNSVLEERCDLTMLTESRVGSSSKRTARGSHFWAWETRVTPNATKLSLVVSSPREYAPYSSLANPGGRLLHNRHQ